jgi:ornithine decarboxylase
VFSKFRSPIIAPRTYDGIAFPRFGNTSTKMTSPILAPDLVWKLLNQHGSPLLVGSRSFARQQFRRLREVLPSIEWFYAVKANDDPELLQTLAAEGCGFDVASYSELEKVRRYGENGGILHSHPCKSPSDLRQCYRAGQRRFVIDCESELTKMATLAPEARLLIRLNVPHGSGQVTFAHRFGAHIDAVVRLVKESQSLGLPIEGLAFHVGSQAIDPADFGAALAVARAAWKLLDAAGIELSILDIGGGFPVCYRTQPVLPLEAYCQAVGQMILDQFGDLNVKVIAEPGRVLCAEAVSLIASVIGKQYRNGKLWYTLDDGRYSSFSGRYYSVNSFELLPYPRPRVEHSINPSNIDRTLKPCVVAGPTCDGGDIVACDYPLPSLEIGDAIVATKMGAYSAVSASDFNGIPKAKRVWTE